MYLLFHVCSGFHFYEENCVWIPLAKKPFYILRTLLLFFLKYTISMTSVGESGFCRLQDVKVCTVKATVFGVFEDLKFKISEGYKQNWTETANRADSGQLQFWSEPSEILNLSSSNTPETVAFTIHTLIPWSLKNPESPRLHTIHAIWLISKHVFSKPMKTNYLAWINISLTTLFSVLSDR